MDNLIKSFKSLKCYEWIMIIVMIAIAGYSMISSFVNPYSSSLPPWLTIINFISVICGIICIFFCAKASISSFVFGIVKLLYMLFIFHIDIFMVLFV